ncbi:hypothetical protein V1525DRAFT_414774 [Lipomyces kononenkoae]|uniref:Uncharacterized protein n=1 Tax=Lipomyces kononenkoae TaxID=34357 RepID=A0ACC3SQM8_LIPKO
MYHHPAPPMPMSPAAKRMRVDGPIPPPHSLQQQPAHGYPAPPHHIPQVPLGVQSQNPGSSQISGVPGQVPGQLAHGVPSSVQQQQQQSQAAPASMYAAHHSLLLSLDDEDLVGAADELDTISAREISASRYARHHEWMEQVLGSAYQSDKIIAPGIFATRSNGGSVWGSLEALKERVESLAEEVGGVDELYTQNLFEVREGKVAALKQGERRLTRLIDRDSAESGGRLRLLEDADSKMDRIVKEVEERTGVKAAGRDVSGVERVRWDGNIEGPLPQVAEE